MSATCLMLAIPLGGGGFVAEFAVRLRPGMRKAVPLGKWGEIAVEAGQ